MKKPTLLCILDGFGLNPNPLGNAVHLAKKPIINALLAGSPNATLTTFGEAVGLPAGLDRRIGRGRGGGARQRIHVNDSHSLCMQGCECSAINQQ